jgi:hypothetical protein
VIPAIDDDSSEGGLGIMDQVDYDLKVLLGQRVRGLVLDGVETADH